MVVQRFCLVATLRYCTLSWDCFDWFFLITGITRTSFVVVPCKLWSFCCCSTLLLFLFSLSINAVDLRCLLFLPFLWHFLIKLERINFSVVYLICSWKIFTITVALSLLYLRACVSFCLSYQFLYWFLVLFASTLFGRWLQHHGLTGHIRFLFHPMLDNILILLRHLIDTQ